MTKWAYGWNYVTSDYWDRLEHLRALVQDQVDSTYNKLHHLGRI